MASGSIGSSGGWTNLENAQSINCTLGANEYPSGTITFNNIGSGAFWYTGGNHNPMTVWLCDSSGGNAYKLFDVSFSSEGTNIDTKTATGMSCPNLKGKALYIKATRSTDWSYLNLRNYTTVTIGTALDQVSCTVTAGSGGTASGGGAHTPGVAVNISASPSTGYRFSGWSCTFGSGTFGSTSSASTTFTSSVDSTVKASFSINSYTVTVNGTANSWVYGSQHTITASPPTGYHFTSWSLSGSGSIASTSSASTTFTVGAGNATVTANYAINTYTITVNGTANTWNYNSAHTITAPSAPTGKQFSSWSKSGYGSIANSSASSTTFTVGLGNATVTTNYSWIYRTVSKASNPSAGGTVTLGTTSAHYGETVTVGATPATGYQLSSWSTNVSGVVVSNSKFTMPNSAITVTANFSKIGYSVTMKANPAAGGTPTASKTTANYGDSITLSNGRASGYIFDGWTSSDVTITNNAFTMPAKNVTVTGNYHIGRSTGTLSSSSFTPGDTVTLTISPQDNTFYHKYKLSFGIGMETDLTTVAAGTTSVSIYIPLAWSRMMTSYQKTGGTLTLYTYESDNTLMGEYTISGLTYNALNGTIPKLTIRRADNAETLNVKGTKARYTIAVPSGIDSYTLACNNSSVENPTKTGLILPENTMTFATDTSVVVTLTIVYGSETFVLTESVPSVWLLSKSVG